MRNNWPEIRPGVETPELVVFCFESRTEGYSGKPAANPLDRNRLRCKKFVIVSRGR